MSDWRTLVRALTSLGTNAEFPLLVYGNPPATSTSWPAELAQPLASIREFYSLCDGGYFGRHHRFIPIDELVTDTERWFKAETPPFDRTRHVLLGYDVWGHPIVWDQQTDLLFRFDYRDTGTFLPLGQTIEQFMAEMFSPNYQDEMWQEALQQLQNENLRGYELRRCQLRQAYLRVFEVIPNRRSDDRPLGLEPTYPRGETIVFEPNKRSQGT